MRAWCFLLLVLVCPALGGCVEVATLAFGALLSPLQAEATREQRARLAQDLFPALDCRPNQALDAGELSRLRLTTNPVVPEGKAPEAEAWAKHDANQDAQLNLAEFMAFMLAFPELRQAGYDAGRCVLAPSPSPSPDEPASYFAPNGAWPLPLP